MAGAIGAIGEGHSGRKRVAKRGVQSQQEGERKRPQQKEHSGRKRAVRIPQEREGEQILMGGR